MEAINSILSNYTIDANNIESEREEKKAALKKSVEVQLNKSASAILNKAWVKTLGHGTVESYVRPSKITIEADVDGDDCLTFQGELIYAMPQNGRFVYVKDARYKGNGISDHWGDNYELDFLQLPLETIIERRLASNKYIANLVKAINSQFKDLVWTRGAKHFAPIKYLPSFAFGEPYMYDLLEMKQTSATKKKMINISPSAYRKASIENGDLVEINVGFNTIPTPSYTEYTTMKEIEVSDYLDKLTNEVLGEVMA